MTNPDNLPLRPALKSQLGFVRDCLAASAKEAFPELPELADWELSRFSTPYLRALIDADPYNVVIPGHGQMHGIMLSSPEWGSLMQHWSYLVPEARKGGLALSSCHQYARHWEGGSYHKISACTRPQNRPVRALLTRVGFKEICTLEKHLFGFDMILLERPLTKAVPGHAHGVSHGIRALAKAKLSRILSLKR